MKSTITKDNLDDALMWPEYYHWGPDEDEEHTTQGGGTAVWSNDQQNYVFKNPPEWWKECKPGDPVPEEWGLL